MKYKKIAGKYKWLLSGVRLHSNASLFIINSFYLSGIGGRNSLSQKAKKN